MRVLVTGAAALDGVDKVYLAPHLPTAAEVTTLIADAGVRHVVDLGGGEGTEWREVEAPWRPPASPGHTWSPGEARRAASGRPPAGRPGSP
jgi:hypothetical protein